MTLRYYKSLISRITEADEPDLGIVRQLLHPGDTVVSIGANIGVYTRFLATYIGPQGRVISFEPIPQTCRILESNLHHLGITNVEIHNKAVSDVCGEVVMNVPRYDNGVENYYEARIVGTGQFQASGSVRVTAVRLDDFLADVRGRVALLKCDAEGHEYHCMAGAAALLKRHRCAVLVELSEHFERLAENRTLLLLRELGYEAFVNKTGQLHSARQEDRVANHFFLLPEHQKALAHLLISSLHGWKPSLENEVRDPEGRSE